MATQVDICNMALAYLGNEATVTSLNPPEGSAEAEHCARFYPIARNELLAVHPWSFAKRRERLARLAQEPEGQPGYHYYPLPADCIQLIKAFSSASSEMRTLSYTIETTEAGPVIVAKYPDLWVTYISSKVRETEFSALFTNALVHKLAILLAGPLMGGSSGGAFLRDHYAIFEKVLEKAQKADARQQPTKAKYKTPFIGDADPEVHDVFD